MVKLPPAIQKQVEAAEALEKQLTGETEAPTEVKPPETDPTPEPVERALEAQPAPTVQSDDNQPAKPTEAPTAPPAPEKRNDEETWEKRYKTLQGMHNQNVADLKGRLSQRDSDIETLKKRLQEMETAQAQAAPKFDQKDIEAFGEDMLAMVTRVVEAKLGQTTSMVDSRVADLNERVQQAASTAAKSAEELFLERLAVRVPDFREVNVDQGFLDWLGETDPIYGLPRQAALDNAAAQRDLDRVARVFETYKAETAPATQSTKPKEDVSLQRQVAPRQGPSTQPAAAPAARIYTVKEIETFYDSVVRGKWKGREEEALKEEAAINAAVAEGRIR